MNSTRIRCHINAPRASVYRALLDARAIAKWKVPDGMTCHVHAFHAREGGSFRISLTYDAPSSESAVTAGRRQHAPAARFTGERIARQAIMYQRRLECDSPEGMLICDEIVAPTDMDAAIDNVVENFTGSGVVSSASNRRAMRVSQEPLDLFRRYFATYALEQAYCHFSPALIANLEMHWNAKSRKL